MEILIMSTKFICDACGMTLDEPASFCPTCGARMRTEEVADAPAADFAAGVNTEPVQQPASPSFDSVMNGGETPHSNAGIPPVPPADMPPFINSNSGNMGVPPVPPSSPYNYTPQPEQQKSGKDTLALLGMIFGIVSVVFCCMNLLDLPFAIAGVILSILGLKSLRRKGMAIAGVICSSIATILCIIIFCSGMAALNEAGDTIYDSFMQGFEEGLQDGLDDDDDFEYEYKYDWN